MTYIPVGNRLVIKKIKENKVKGLSIPKSAGVEEKAIGEVVVSNDENFKIGERIIYDEFAGSLIPDEEDLIILDIKYVLAKIL